MALMIPGPFFLSSLSPNQIILIRRMYHSLFIYLSHYTRVCVCVGPSFYHIGWMTLGPIFVLSCSSFWGLVHLNWIARYIASCHILMYFRCLVCILTRIERSLVNKLTLLRLLACCAQIKSCLTTTPPFCFVFDHSHYSQLEHEHSTNQHEQQQQHEPNVSSFFFYLSLFIYTYMFECVKYILSPYIE